MHLLLFLWIELVGGGKKVQNAAKGGVMPQRDYRIQLGDLADGVALNWTIRATSELEAVQRSRRWFEERRPSGSSSPVQIEVHDSALGIERDSPEVPTAFQIEIDPRRLTPAHVRFQTDSTSE